MQKVKIMTGLIGLMMIGAVVGCSKSDNNEPKVEKGNLVPLFIEKCYRICLTELMVEVE